MASSRNSKSKSTGLRILWIPGGRKSHPKGRYDSTSKQVSYASGSLQKKSEVWSLGGSRAQKDLLNAEPDTSILDGPTVSGLSPITCATVGAAATCVVNNKTTDDNISVDNLTNLPITPNSTSSTAPLVSIPNSPEEATALPTAETTDSTMPAKTTVPTITVTTTTAEIIESRKNRFALLNEINCNDINTFDLPLVPKFENNLTLDTSGGTTASTATSPSTSPRHNNTNNGTESPTKKKNKHQNHNNNQGDVNSIESISDNKSMDKTIKDLNWIDDLNTELDSKPVPTSKSKNKKKKKHTTTKEMDQLDGVPIKSKEKDAPPDDEKVVKCLYYTLMCCDCTIS